MRKGNNNKFKITWQFTGDPLGEERLHQAFNYILNIKDLQNDKPKIKKNRKGT